MIEDNEGHFIDDPIEVVNAKIDFTGMGLPPRTFRSPKRAKFATAAKLIGRIDELQDFAGKLYARFSGIDERSTDEQIGDVFRFVVKSGYKDMLFDAIKGIRDKVYNEINRLEKELDEL